MRCAGRAPEGGATGGIFGTDTRSALPIRRQQRPVVAGIDLALDRGGITAVVGPNGSGKTTLTRLMVGILRPDDGSIRLENRSLREYSLAEIGRCIGYVFQNPDQQLFCNTVAEEIGFGLQHLGWEREGDRGEGGVLPGLL